MYENYFGLSELPFAITPDPRFVFLSERHEDALAHLRYGIGRGGGGGFVQLTGEVGTGKTTLCRCTLEDLPADTRIALILNPKLEPLELLEAICDELKISTRGAKTSQKKLVDKLNKYLLEAYADGATVVLIIDEAQNLSRDALEQVRLLTNLETASQKLLQIILLGQPELREMLKRSDLRQLAQRITARYHLTPLSLAETQTYVSHRLQVAGASRNPFTRGAIKTLHKASGGVPRLINIIADRALMSAYAKDQSEISSATVRSAVREVQGDESEVRSGFPVRWALPTSAIAAALLAFVLWEPKADEAFVDGGQKVAVESPDLEVPAEPLDQDDATQEGAINSEDSQDDADNVVPAEPQAIRMDAEIAWNTLLQARGLEEATPAASFDGQSCPDTSNVALACWAQRGAIPQLGNLSRPVLVDVGQDQFAVVEVAGEQVFWLGPAAESPSATSLSELASIWNGRFIDIWQQPSYVPPLLKEGDRGPAVFWLKQVAANAQPPFKQDPNDPYFGPSTATWVRTFQATVGLRDDGVVGPETWQQLATFVTTSENL